MTAHTRWQYLVIDLKVKVFEGSAAQAQRLQDELNRHGQQGWELVSLDANPMTGSPLAIFKRPMP